MIIGTNFYETSKIFTNTVGDFVTTTNDFSDINTNLIPTKDRGFYSHSTSNLKSKSTISIAPHFTIKFYIKPIANGILLTLENLFSIGLSGSAYLNIFLSHTVDCFEYSYSFNMEFTLGQWTRFIIGSFYSVEGYFQLEYIVNEVCNYYTLGNYEMPRKDLSYLYIGSSTNSGTAPGFYYKLEI